MNPTVLPAALSKPTRARRALLRSWRHLAITMPADAPELLAPIRLVVKTNLLAWGAKQEKAEDIELCVSELLTNALRYSSGPARLELNVHGGAVHLQVSDTAAATPHEVGQSEGRREHGRGLHIVKELAFAHAVRVHPRWGKTVTASFRV